MLVSLGATGVYNIGSPRRSFAEILHDEGLSVKRRTRRAYIWDGLRDTLYDPAPYPFPADSSVNTEKYDAFVRGS